jgi:hypothetical protein
MRTRQLAKVAPFASGIELHPKKRLGDFFQ